MPLLFLDVTFHDAIENINVATVMELRRDGHWAMPRLLGEVRWAKPPLTTWITASGITSRTLVALAGSDPASAESALRWLAFETRWPAALASCLMLAAIYELGRTLGGRELGLTAALVAGTSLLFVRQSHTATIDAQLALCVAAANMFLAKAIFAQKRWLGLIGTGLAIGLGLMHKGPVVLLPIQVIIRQSTDILAIEDADVAAAMHFIRNHAGEPIDVEDVLREVPISRRTLERRFRERLGRSPRKEIRRMHLERAKELLLTTTLSTSDVAFRSGLPDAAKLSMLFRKEYRQTPTEFRRTSRRGR